MILLDYTVNKQAYEMKCCNKSNLKMKCHGRCQMMKKLQEEEKKEQDQEKNTDTKTEPLSSRSFFATVHMPEVTDKIISLLSFYTTGKAVRRATEIFHPPKIISA